MLVVAGCPRSEAGELPDAIARLDALMLAQPVRADGEWLLFGRFELTLTEYLPDERHVDGEIPATRLSLADCEAWCAPRGLRLPDREEWQMLATGGVGRAWSSGLRRPRNDLGLELSRPLPVGVFERGRLATGGYDFFGNVWERLAAEGDGRTLAAGGSYASSAGGPFELLELAPDDQLEDVGMRYVADAADYVLEQVLPAWRELPRGDRDRCAALFAQWRPDLRRSFAEQLRARGAPDDFCAQVEGP